MNDQKPSVSALINHGRRHPEDSGRSVPPSGLAGAGALSRRALGSSLDAAEQERYVTSAAIESVRKKIDTDLKQFFTAIKTYVDDTEIPFPGWGALGSLFIGLEYSNKQNNVRKVADNGHDTSHAMASALGIVVTNWRNAEDANMAVYQ